MIIIPTDYFSISEHVLSVTSYTASRLRHGVRLLVLRPNIISYLTASDNVSTTQASRVDTGRGVRAAVFRGGVSFVRIAVNGRRCVRFTIAFVVANMKEHVPCAVSLRVSRRHVAVAANDRCRSPLQDWTMPAGRSVVLPLKSTGTWQSISRQSTDRQPANDAAPTNVER